MEDADLDYRHKGHCVDELAKRWWYAMPEWPPAGYNYQSKLRSVGFREVDPAKFKMEPEFDGEQLRKVCQLETFEGVYKDSS